ncbi:MAG: carboxypeptidase-like regulatory domain-containing protein [Nanoarchaeota archaeon]
MGGKTAFISAASILFVLFFVSPVFASEGYGSGEASCTAFCSAKNYAAAADCFMNNRAKSDAYLATSQCALTNFDDAIAEEYALKSAKERSEWIMFVRNLPGFAGRIKTGGLGETYTTAYFASGGARHKSKAIEYLKTSGQCQDDADPEPCALLYFNNTLRILESRMAVTSRGALPEWVKEGLHGRITDMDGDPIKRANVTFKCGAKEFKTLTDADGKYRFSYDKNLSASDLCTEGRIYVKLQYYGTDGKMYFVILFNNQPVWAMKKFKLEKQADLVQDFQINETLVPAGDYAALPNIRDIHDYAVMHKHLAEAVEYYKDVLKADISYKLPVEIYPCVGGNPGTYYDPTDSSIVIDSNDCDHADSDKPRNREWHEFSHHAMFSLYTQWPQPPPGAALDTLNHDGYMNPSTSDSFMEGFAEYMSLMIAEHYKYPQPGVYASFGSIDTNWKAWDRRGKYEELAIAGILWDLYDGKDDDQVQIPFKDIWDELQDYRNDFTDFYTRFTTTFPRQKDNIDEVFKQHGFFADKTPGNRSYDHVEAFRDANKNNRREAAEPYIDYAIEPLWAFSYMVWQAGEPMGSATNYERPTRKSAVKEPGHYVKVDNDVPLYKMKFSFDNPKLDYETLSDNDDGFVYVNVPPYEYTAKVTVEPVAVQFSKPLVIDNKEFELAFPDAEERGYYVEHDFGIKGSVVVQEHASQTVKSTPYWEATDVKATKEDYVYHPPKDDDSYITDASISSLGTGGIPSLAGFQEKNIFGKSKPWSLIIGIVVFVAVVAVIFIVKKKKKGKK